jgi:16S rRNA (cytidine1402-2'-O)-methyltransferase
MTRPGDLYLLPTLLGDAPPDAVLPRATLEQARRIDYLLAEDARSARAFLKGIGHPRPIAQIRIVEIGHAPRANQLDEWLAPIRAGLDAAIVSEAGCPGVADPGASLVARAHVLGIAVKPLVGPSALLLALMAAGLNGQQFRFVGYLPRDSVELAHRLRELERASRQGETQIFIETPYRNDKLLAAILAACGDDTKLSIAVDLTTAAERIVTLAIQDWRQSTPPRRPDLDRRPAVFSLLAARAADPSGLRARRSGRR